MSTERNRANDAEVIHDRMDAIDAAFDQFTNKVCQGTVAEHELVAQAIGAINDGRLPRVMISASHDLTTTAHFLNGKVPDGLLVAHIYHDRLGTPESPKAILSLASEANQYRKDLVAAGVARMFGNFYIRSHMILERGLPARPWPWMGGLLERLDEAMPIAKAE